MVKFDENKPSGRPLFDLISHYSFTSTDNGPPAINNILVGNTNYYKSMEQRNYNNLDYHKEVGLCVRHIEGVRLLDWDPRAIGGDSLFSVFLVVVELFEKH